MRTTLTLLLVCCCQSLFAQNDTDLTLSDLRHAELRMTALVNSHSLEMHDARNSLAVAEYDLAVFNSFGKIETAKTLALDLFLEQDALSNAIEELEQLKIMYDRNNLADVTAQMVLDRAERSLLRQQISVELAQTAIAKWEQFGMIHQQRELNDAVTSAKLNLAYLEAEHVSSRFELNREIDDIKLALAEIRAETNNE